MSFALDRLQQFLRGVSVCASSFLNRLSGPSFIHTALSSSQAAGAVGSSEVPPRSQGAAGAGMSEPHEEAPGPFA